MRDGIHIHIDAGGNEVLLTSIASHLNNRGYATKVRCVDSSAAGPQRKKLPTIYDVHNPIIGTVEVFDYFSTTSVASRKELLHVAKDIVHKCRSFQGVVVEAEQVIGYFNEHGLREATELVESVIAIEPLVEVHHKIDLPRSYGIPFSAQELCDLCEKVGVELGGAFIFHDETLVKYRTNAFFPSIDWPCIEGQYRAIEQIFRLKGLNFCQGVLWEKVLGIWSF